MTMQMELALEDRGEAPNVRWSGEARSAVQGDERSGSGGLREGIEQVVERGNLKAALARVRKNKGSPGIDGMGVDELLPFLRENWERMRAELLAGSYQPSAVRRQEIPKSGGGVRQLGIPTVLDRFIQQAILQVLQPLFDPTFSAHSYRFRPGRRAHDAVCQAQRYVQAGRRWVVDVDLEKFFDRVNHDVLMGRLEKRIGDTRLLRVIRRYLEAGVLAEGRVVERHEGTPQGGPLSPLLANVLLDEVDRALERSGHAFVRYADDCNMYVRSKRAGERVMEHLRGLYAKLRLRVNEDKSAVVRAWDRKFLGYSFWVAAGRQVKRRVAPKALEDFKQRIRQLTSRTGGRSLGKVVEELRAYVLGWKAYFHLADTPGVFRDLDQWIARRLRRVQLKQWKRAATAYREMRTRGVPEWLALKAARFARNWWRLAAHGALHTASPGRLFEQMGLSRLAPH
ncbi:MAG TPA: group II intron reverse transcriptase/maturase [Longimicrobiaceae bacterium]|nr:group II intron reverse transcriptase/maturase [Longimicrobiaceae bacterium]